jgi:tryptophanyl-tRNA synthetase
MSEKRPRVFSGIQPTGEPHLGNYLGAFKHWVARQNDRENFFCIVDLHSLTAPYDPEGLRERTRKLAAVLYAVGIDPDLSVLFVQSHVPAHSEACWLLNCVTPLSWLQKMTQYKDKSKQQESVGTGLLDYPVLMACDILLYDADEVPVGEDQKQHVELTRNIAGRFNHQYGETFIMPEPMIPEVAARVMGLDDPTRKMSKSASTVRGHAVGVLDDPDEILRSFKRAKTDAHTEIRFSDEPERAGVNNLLSIYQAVTERGKDEVERDFSDARGYGDLKVRVAEVVIESLRPIRERSSELLEDPDQLDRWLAMGAEQAEAIAGAKLRHMQDRMGLVLAVRS